MSDSGKKAPNHYDSLMDKAKSSWLISILLVSFALLSSAKGVMESIDYFSQKFFNKKDQPAVTAATAITAPAAGADSTRTKTADAATSASLREKAAQKTTAPAARDNKPAEKNTYSLLRIQSELNALFRQKGQAARVEMDDTGEMSILQQNGAYAKFMIQHIRLEWNSVDKTVGLVSDKKSIVWRGIDTFPDGSRGWASARIAGVMYYFSKSDFETIKQLLAQYRKYISERKK